MAKLLRGYAIEFNNETMEQFNNGIYGLSGIVTVVVSTPVMFFITRSVSHETTTRIMPITA